MQSVRRQETPCRFRSLQERRKINGDNNADAVYENSCGIGKGKAKYKPQITVFLWCNPVQKGKNQHDKENHHKADAGTGRRDKKAVKIADIPFMRKIFKSDAAQDADPPCGGGQHPDYDIAVSCFGEIA